MSHHLITGGAGFLGSALARRLVAEGERVTVLDRFSRGKRERLPANVHAIVGDVCDGPLVRHAVKSCDVVWHLAYIQGTQTFYGRPRDVIDVALQGIMNVLGGCAQKATPPEFVLVSSSEVYQEPPPDMFPTDETVPLSVPDVLNPRYSYGGGKIASEIATLAYAQAGALGRALIVRPHNIYGADMGTDHVVPQFAARMMELIERRKHPTAALIPVGEELVAAHDLGVTVQDYIKGRPIQFPIQGTGHETRSFCFIDDAVDGLLVLLDKGEDRNVYHLGNPFEEHSIHDLAHRVAAYFGAEIEVIPGELPKGSPTRRLPDISKMAALGFAPRVDLAEGLDSTLSWYWEQSEHAPIVA